MDKKIAQMTVKGLATDNTMVLLETQTRKAYSRIFTFFQDSCVYGVGDILFNVNDVTSVRFENDIYKITVDAY